ncbi:MULTISPECIES: MetQ/NlpA family ABC transporter substrate-binding protein [unclassified Diaminobutyricimonas]|uniref:MetQ/NlpA family ABC transporter substrate-binding protein n=1 Tax=unclassified Diaminobutyricimonas TaxID=2643261 RepID=UPI0012F4DA46|nr:MULTISPECIES: MetQ/NlpA family ABC transporter substrate-binding protein [unclassified Diaminobutyricimonas]
MANTKADAPVLPERKKSKTGLIVGVAVAAVAVIIAAILIVPSVFGNKAEPAAAGDAPLTTVKIGTTDASQPHWQILSELLLEEGIELELVNFTEYPLPNPALAAGETDLNAFQHLDYLSNHNVATGDDLQPIGSTIIVPLPLYSEKWDSVEEIPDGAQIAIPNDPSNQARALGVLESAGLITLDGKEQVPTPANIDAAKSRVTVIPIEASQTPAALQSADGAIINNNFSRDAGLDPQTALFSVDPNDPKSWPYLNVIAARADDIDNPTYLRVAKLYHSPAVVDSVVESSGGTAVVIELDPEELRDRLASIEEDKRAAK